jgi:hypothetical protein
MAIERFAEKLIPQLTPDELKPLGLSLNELQTHYVTSLIMPREPDPTKKSDHINYLLLTRQSDWQLMQQLFQQIRRNPEAQQDEFPEECLISVKVDGDNLELNIETMLRMLPDVGFVYADFYGSEVGSFVSNNCVSVHAPRIRMPASLLGFGREAYSEDFNERWPFVTPDKGLPCEDCSAFFVNDVFFTE